LSKVAAACVAAWLCLFVAPSDAAELKPWSEPAPPFVWPAANGSEFKLEGHRNPVMLVHFFATWCEPCREELPALNRLADRGDPKIVVVAVAVAEGDLRVRRFLQTMPLNFRVLLDRDRAVAKAWSISTLPSTVILDADLVPRLAVETDFAWDRIDPEGLTEILEKLRAKQAIKPIRENPS
jgi:thiol-disulfide isomerase/thioredoxin